MQRVWVGAIRRLMDMRGYRSARSFCDATGVRPNTLSDALNESKHTKTRISTFMEIAEGLNVPLWALFCDEREYVLFTEQVKQAEAATQATAQADQIRAVIEAELAPLRQALLDKFTGQSVSQPANPLPTVLTRAERTKTRQRKAGR